MTDREPINTMGVVAFPSPDSLDAGTQLRKLFKLGTTVQNHFYNAVGCRGIMQFGFDIALDLLYIPQSLRRISQLHSAVTSIR